MLLEELLSRPNDYAHIVALTSGEYEIIAETPDFFILHSKVSDIYAVELRDDSFADAATNLLKKEACDLLLTTSPAVFSRMRSGYPDSYMCDQYVFTGEFPADPNARVLDEQELSYVIATYHDPEYIRQLYDRKRILGYYADGHMVGYIAFHIDGTLGALYVDPAYRRKAYGSAIVKAAVSHFSNRDRAPLYSHVVSDNHASIALHHSLGAVKSQPDIYWMHRRGFSF